MIPSHSAVTVPEVSPDGAAAKQLESGPTVHWAFEQFSFRVHFSAGSVGVNRVGRMGPSAPRRSPCLRLDDLVVCEELRKNRLSGGRALWLYGSVKQQRPATARAVTNSLKLHRHLVRLPGRAYTVITLRPGTRVRFSTNRFHGTWHVLSDDHGARLLARLLWGLSYQARPGTIVLIDRRFLAPTPFDADPADPMVLVPGWCTAFDDRAAGRLKSRFPLPGPEGTVRWRTVGLDRTLEPQVLDDWWAHYRYREERGSISRRRGLLVLAPSTPDESRAWALRTARLDATNRFGTDYAYLGPWDGGHDGEVQIFRRFRPMVSVASQARAQVLSRSDAPTDPDYVRWAVWREAEVVRGEAHLRIREWQGGCWQLGRDAAVMLAQADVAPLEDLADVGSVEAYRRMCVAEVKGLNLEMLWAMEGALTYRDRRSISADRGRELLARLGEEPATHPASPRRRYRTPGRRAPHYSRPLTVSCRRQDGRVGSVPDC